VCDDHFSLRREVKILRACLIVGICSVGALALTAFQRAGAPTRFDEIDVQRINIREPNGKLRMVLSNRPRSPGGIAHGKAVGGDGSRPGMIFYNDEETENGGFVFEGRGGKDGHTAGAQLSLDQYDQDQVLTLVYDDDGGKRTAGLNVYDRPDVAMVPWFATRDSVRHLPDGPDKVSANQLLLNQLRGKPMTAPRVFIGRDASSAAILRLSDPFGRPRLRLVVDSLGSARIEFLDLRGRVTQQLSPARDSAGPPN
jgi:hypothetical protein